MTTNLENIIAHTQADAGIHFPSNCCFIMLVTCWMLLDFMNNYSFKIAFKIWSKTN